MPLHGPNPNSEPAPSAGQFVFLAQSVLATIIKIWKQTDKAVAKIESYSLGVFGLTRLPVVGLFTSISCVHQGVFRLPPYPRQVRRLRAAVPAPATCNDWHGIYGQNMSTNGGGDWNSATNPAFPPLPLNSVAIWVCTARKCWTV